MTLYYDCSFYFVIKDVVNSKFHSKMAESGWDRERFANGRSRALTDAIAYFENQRRGRGRINIGQAGLVPRTLNRSTEKEDNMWDEDQIP